MIFIDAVPATKDTLSTVRHTLRAVPCLVSTSFFFCAALARSRVQDVKRTLGMSDVSALRNVLRCTSTFVPDVGYVQVGRTTLIAVLYSLAGMR